MKSVIVLLNASANREQRTILTGKDFVFMYGMTGSPGLFRLPEYS